MQGSLTAVVVRFTIRKKKVNLSGWEWVEPAFHAEKNDVTFDVVANVTMGVSGLAIIGLYSLKKNYRFAYLF